MSSETHIRIENTDNGAVRRIVLARPEKRNALTPAMFDKLVDAFDRAPAPEERVVAIQGEGSVFCAGVDLSERIQNGWPQESPLVKLCEAMRRYPIPIVGAIQGDAIAGGCMMTLHCDLILAAEGAHLTMPLAQLGIAPPWILTARTIQRVGPALGREMLFVGNPIPVERLLNANAINSVVPRNELETHLSNLLDTLSTNAPLSARAVKAATSRLAEADVDVSHDFEDSLVRTALDSADAKEGMKARLERRKPQFLGQ